MTNSTNNTNSNTYVVYVDGQAVYGIGETLEEAIEDAAQYLDGMLAEEIAEQIEENKYDPYEQDVLRAAPCTEKLREHVIDDGGRCKFFINEDGQLDLLEE